MDLKRLFLRALVGSLCATAGLAIFTLLFAEFDETAGRIVGTTAFLSLYSLLSLPGGVLLDQGRLTHLAWALIGLSALGFVLAMVVLWGDVEGEALSKTLLTVSVLAGACAQTAATASRRRPDDQARVARLYRLSIGLGFALATLASLAAWAEIDTGGYYRFLGAVAVADVLVVLLQPILRRMLPAPAEAERRGYRLAFTLDREPPSEAVEDAAKALERAGARVERIERHP